MSYILLNDIYIKNLFNLINNLLTYTIIFNIICIFFIFNINNIYCSIYGYTINIIKFIILVFIVINLLFTTIRFTIKIIYNISFNLEFYSNNKYNFFFNYINFTNGGYLSDILVLLAIIVTFLSIWVFNEKNLNLFSANMPLFCIFITIIQILAYSSNLFIMFISYEILFLPTMYFSLVATYTKNDDKAIRSILYWTLTGSFLVLISLSYLYYIQHTFDINILLKATFSTKETIILIILLIFGFGTKIPIFPFYYWITKIHVETSTGYSMFLSGFLVKAALYCLYFFIIILIKKDIYIYIAIFILIGLIFISFHMWLQVDLKKLIAYSSVYEMSLMLLLIFLKQNILSNIIVIFFFFHSIFSCMMFFIVDILQKRYKTRNIGTITGSDYKISTLTPFIWLQLLYFTSFPLTIKFYLELQIFLLLYENFNIISIFFIIIIIFLVNICFCKAFFIVMYGVYNNSYDIKFIININKAECNILVFIVFFLSISFIFLFIV